MAHVDDFEDGATTATLTKQALIKELESGQATLDIDEHCIAVVRPENWKPGRPNSVLWLFFVRKNKRGTGVGKQFVVDILKRYAQRCPMGLVCNGADRITFFEKCGFSVVRIDSDGAAVMQSIENASDLIGSAGD